MAEPSRTETPRDELRRRIVEALSFTAAADECADAVMGLFRSVREDYEDTYWTTLADQRDRISRQRFIVAEMPREAAPERIEGAWRG